MNVMKSFVYISLLVALVFVVGGCSSSAKDPLAGKPDKPAPQVIEAPQGSPSQVQATTGYSNVAEQAVKGIVNISSTKIVRTPQRQSPFQNDPFFRRFFGERLPNQVPRERRERSRGSGVIVSKDGYVLTNNHVIDGAAEVSVVLYDEREFAATIIGTDPKTDVAVLKINVDGLEPLPLGRSAALRLGEVVLAIGNPFGLSHTVTQGIVSALGRARVGIADYEDFIQTDAAINPGNSGGALINTRGELVGINTAIASMSGGYQGVGFAIPVDMARVIMDSLVQYGRVERGYLGVLIQDVRQDMLDQFGLKKPHGAIIADVLKDGPADQAGLQRGDVVLEMNGLEIDDSAQFRNLVSQLAPGKEISLTIQRKRKRREIAVLIGRHPDDAESVAQTADRDDAAGPELHTLNGVTVVNITREVAAHYDLPPNARGIVVIEVKRGSHGAAAGLRPGDVVTEVNRSPIVSVDEFATAIKNAKRKKLLLLVNRGGATTFVMLHIK